MAGLSQKESKTDPPDARDGHSQVESDASVKKNLLEAIDLALAGQWEAAHTIVQQYDSDKTAAWIHAVLHKIEGDPDNSRYWYRRADKLEHLSAAPQAELTAIRTELAG